MFMRQPRQNHYGTQYLIEIIWNINEKIVGFILED